MCPFHILINENSSIGDLYIMLYNHIKENRKQSLNRKRSIGQGISMLLYDQLFIYHLPFISNCYILIALRGKVIPNPQID